MADCKKIGIKIEENIFLGVKKENLPEDIKNHIESCNSCSALYNEISETLYIIKQRERVEPTEAFLDNLWNNIEPNLKPSKSRKLSINSIWKDFQKWFYLKPGWTFQIAGAAVLLIIGILIGKYFIAVPNEMAIPENNLNVVQASVEERAGRYIDRSKVLLLGLMNIEPEKENFETINLQHQKNISKELIQQASELKNELNNPGQLRLKELVSELELILLQIANLEIEQDITGIELIKSGVDRRGIFLKINIQKMTDEIQSEKSTKRKKNDQI